MKKTKKESPRESWGGNRKKSTATAMVRASLARSALVLVLAVAAAGLFAAPAARADFVYSGYLDPGNPSTWQGGPTGTIVYVGGKDTNPPVGGDGSLTVNKKSSLASKTAYVGVLSGYTGAITVDGAGSSWTNGTLYLGAAGMGVINVTNGGTVSTNSANIGLSTGGVGWITVDGTGSTFTSTGSGGYLDVGGNGAGQIIIKNGGAFMSSSTINLGRYAGGIGAVTVDGAGSRLTNTGGLYVGKGTGMISITNGGTLTATTISGGTGAITVDGANSKLISNGTTADTGALSVNSAMSITNGSTVTASGRTLVGNLGAVNFGASGGTLTTGTLLASGQQMTGTGTVNAGGIVTDTDLVFDATHGTTQTLALGGVTVNLAQSASNSLGAGHLGTGTLTIKDGVALTAYSGFLGYLAGSSGTATVNGARSTWANSTYLYAGYNGNGTLRIMNGGTVSDSMGYLGYLKGSSGTATVSGPGSTWTSSSNLYVGNSGTGTLRITNGGAVSDAIGYLGFSAGSPGTATVSGPGSTWASSDTLYMGFRGNGTLRITNGGAVSSLGAVSGVGASLGEYSGSTGTATVSGAGSTWTVTGATGIKVGNLGTGRLSISDGGAVTASTVNINGSSTLTTDVGRGSSLAVSGDLTNNGTIRLVAGAHAASGTYTPITAGSWTGGTTQALGGVLNADNSMTVNPAVSGTIGTAATINLAAAQRVIFSDGAGKAVVGAGFQAGSGSLSLTATSMSDTSSLEALLASGQSVLSGWDFTASGYTEGSPVYLSLYAGSGQDLSDLSIWHYGTNGWTAYDASDLAYDGTYASFTVTGFSGYAVAGNSPVPVPAAAWLLGSGLFGLAGLRKKFGR
jgi:T5SS/PEP-CTERM-associated repeat protein